MYMLMHFLLSPLSLYAHLTGMHYPVPLQYLFSHFSVRD